MEREERLNALAVDVFQTIPVLYRRILRPDASGMSPFSPPISVLVIVKKRGPVSMTAIAQELSYSKQNLTKIVDQLVQEGLVDRTPDPTDRRVLLIQLTDGGRELMAARRRAMKDRLKQDLSHLTDAELEELHDTFERVKEALPMLLPGKEEVVKGPETRRQGER
ncbi:MAG: MarR family transcriptional regulator [Methanomassiliicoccus sp.]|nr:MarR family transcriptional regulator [Methanomassiliicoccus sp.]